MEIKRKIEVRMRRGIMSLYETAKYEVLEKEGKFEIREYEGFYSAAISEAEPIQTNGFGEIFGYISGDNEGAEKISMTTPVINELKEEGFTTEFVMPNQYREKTPPAPMNDKIVIKKREKIRCGVVTFSGTVNKEKIEKYKQELLEWLSKRNKTSIGTFRLARYNPPITPPPFRRNEILIDITEKV